MFLLFCCDEPPSFHVNLFMLVNREAADEEEVLIETTGEEAAEGAAASSTAAAPVSTTVPVSAVSAAQQAALDRAKVTLQLLKLSKLLLILFEFVQELVRKMSGVDAARRQAEIIAAQLGGKSGATGSLMDHCQDELEINDYPPLARRKVQQKETLEHVTELTGVAIISRGEYIDPAKKPEANKRKLYVHLANSCDFVFVELTRFVRSLLGTC